MRSESAVFIGLKKGSLSGFSRQRHAEDLLRTRPHESNTSKTEHLLKESTFPQHVTRKSWPIRVISCRWEGKGLRGLTIAL